MDFVSVHYVISQLGLAEADKADARNIICSITIIMMCSCQKHLFSLLKEEHFMWEISYKVNFFSRGQEERK